MWSHRQSRQQYWWTVLRISLLLCFVKPMLAQIRYSIPEEVNEGYRVGNIAKDLGLDIRSLSERRLRIVSGSKDSLFHIDHSTGVLHAREKIDREELCDGNGACYLDLKIVFEDPLEIHYVRVEVTDINDNSPYFPETEQHFEIAEQTLLGTRFQVQAARDPDVGIYSVRHYKLSHNDHFEIDVRERHEERVPFLVLRKALDREDRVIHKLILTAIDGGSPPKTGTLNIMVTVLDSNDNRPVFTQETYTVTLLENSPVGTVVVQVNATDLDEGSNSAVEYALGRNLNKKVHDVFELDSTTGEIRVKGKVDFEDTDVFKLDVHASDKGQPPLTVECGVLIRVLDVNDNAPEIEVTSLSNLVPENSKPGTVVSLLSVTDMDSGINGKVLCNLSENVPFELKPSFQDNMYSLVTKGHLDREAVSHYDVVITASDFGQPPLSVVKTLSVEIADVNDNRPEFFQNPIYLYMMENNAPGASIFSLITHDKDINENAVISYNVIRDEGDRNSITSFLNINPDNGVIHALKSFDFEVIKKFNFSVVATDSGNPPLSSNVTINVYILDQNDNAPVILFPNNVNGSSEGVEEIPRNVNAGHLVCKVRAFDADIGYNGWLLFSLQEVTDHTLFGLDRYTGQIRTLRAFTESDEARHKLIILVKDNGNVSLSATATVIVSVVEPREAIAASDVHTANNDEESDVTFYLIITLGSVSVLFIISIIVLVIMQCSKPADYSSKYLQDTNYDGTLCHSIQYRSGDKRYMLVGPRMSVSSAVVPGSNMNTLKSTTSHRRSTLEVSRLLGFTLYISGTWTFGWAYNMIQRKSV